MRRWLSVGKGGAVVALTIILAVASAACLDDLPGRDNEPKATATPEKPGPEAAIEQWVRENRNVNFAGDCAQAQEGVDVGKLCILLRGERGARRAYDLGPTFSEPTALAIVEDTPEGWTVVSVTTRDPSAGAIPGIPWPLQVQDSVVVIGLGENDCLLVREQPTQQAKQTICIPDGTTAIIQEGPVEAETFTWWRLAGEGFNGWAAGRWLRLPEAIAEALGG